jgi:undecaprenyl-diphosphatase
MPLACCALAFVALAAVIAARHGAPFRIDVGLHEWSLRRRGPLSLAAGRLLTATAGGALPNVVASLAGWVVTGARAAPSRRIVAAGLAVLDVVLGELVVRASLAAALARPRPPLADWAGAASGGSFPSGHTTVSALAAGLFVWAARRAGPRAACAASAAALAWALAVGLSRVFLGVHWLSDVLGGWLLAAAWLGLTVPTSARLLQRAGRKA